MPDEAPWRGYLLEVPIWTSEGHLRRLQDIENDIIRLAIIHYGGNCSLAAQSLGMSRTNFYRRMRELGIAAPVATERKLRGKWNQLI